MKKTFLLLTIVLFSTASVFADDGGAIQGSNLTWEFITATGTLTISGNGTMPDFTTPPWNSYKNSITNVIIGNGVLSIGSNAFNGYSYLQSLFFTEESSVDIIGSFSFSGCSELSSISIPKKVSSIESGAFNNCGSLKKVTLEDGPGELAIISYTGLGLMNAFNGCNITELYIGRPLETQSGSYYYPTFNDIKTLETLTIGEGIKKVSSSAFSGCIKLTSVSLPNSFEIIESRMFEKCNRLQSIIIPSTVLTTIESFAFSDCSELTSITIPKNVLSIESGAFNNCGSLEKVTLEDGPGELAIISYTGLGLMNAFNGCNIIDLYIGRNLSGGSYYSPTFNDIKTLKTLTIGEYVTSIRASDFSGCVSLAKVVIGSKVNEIGNYAFYGCCELDEIICYPTKPPTVYENTFGGCGKSAHNFPVFINCNYSTDYKNAQFWSEFTNYRSIDTQEPCIVGIVETSRATSPLVFPNPTTGELTITNYDLGPELNSGTSVDIYDIYGKKLSSHHLIPSSSHPLIPSSSNHLINISHLSAGIYFLKIGNETVKVVKQF